jgi:hypothetical protein
MMTETALLGIILGFGTTATIFFLRGFKDSTFFATQALVTLSMTLP